MKASISNNLKKCSAIKIYKKSQCNIVYCKWLNTLFWIFIYFGVDIKEKKSTRRKCVIMYFLTMFSFIFRVYIIILVVNIIKTDYEMKKDLKNSVAGFLLGLTNFLLWWIFLKKKKQISDIIQQLQQLKSIQDSSSKLPIIMITLMVLENVFFLVTSLYIMPKDERNEIFQRYSMGAINTTGFYSKIFLYLIHCISYEYFYFFQSCFFMLYIICCYYWTLILTEYFKQNNNFLNNSKNGLVKLNQSLGQYNDIITRLERYENVMSLPVLVAFLNMSLQFFCNLYYILYTHESVIMRYYVTGYNFTAMTIIIAFATSVNEADIAAKKSIKNIFKMCIKSKTNLNVEDIAEFWTLSITPSFSLTGWGMFRFTKTFYLSAVGCVITYTLLALKL